MTKHAYNILIFMTGAVTLSLELLASRVLTPYFGVSLYIWTAILSITLLSLAIGYYLGGMFSKKGRDDRTNISDIEYLFLKMPAISAIGIFFSCLIYPKLFYHLAQYNLTLGSIIACIILLFIPLVTISAMNPLLVAIFVETHTCDLKNSDSGSGKVFFISTAGSVIGVFFTAFLFIPNVSNFRSILMLGAILSVLSVISQSVNLALDKSQKKTVILLSLTGFFLCMTLNIFSPVYLKKKGEISFERSTWKIDKEYSSIFGSTKILKVKEFDYTMYFQDGIVQNVTGKYGISQTHYTYALDSLSRAVNPYFKKALMLGLGGGILPTWLNERGVSVDVVEINPTSILAASEYFGFNKSAHSIYQMDARSFVKSCNDSYDVIFVDLFAGDGIPEYIMTSEFFSDLKRCLKDDGFSVFNTFSDTLYIKSFYYLLKTIKSEFKEVRMYHEPNLPESGTINIYLTASNKRDLSTNGRVYLRRNVPLSIKTDLIPTLRESRPINEDYLKEATVLTDDYNVFSHINRRNYIAYRRQALSMFPPEFFVN